MVAPNGTLKAVTFRRDCGATTRYSVQVSILPAKKPLSNEGGNVFVASGEPSIVVRWIGDRHLSISGGGGSPGVFKTENPSETSKSHMISHQPSILSVPPTTGRSKAYVS